MKTSFMKNFLYSLMLLLCGATATAYAATPMLYFSSQPGNTSLSGTTTLNYVVHNNVPAPMPLTSFTFTSSSDYTSSISNNCSGSGYAVVPANGNCTVSVALTAVAAGATSNARLTIGYSDQPGTKLVSNGITVTAGGAGTSPLSFVNQPVSPQSVNIGAALTLDYEVTNPNTVAIPVTSIAFTSDALYNPNQPSITVSGAGCTLSSVPPSSSAPFCTYSVHITAGNTAGTANNQKLTLNYTGSGSPLTSNNLAVTVVDPGSVSFSSQPTSPQAVTVGGTTNLVYQVTNTTSISQPLSNLSFPSSSRYTVGSIAVSGAGTCNSSIIPSGASCTITVPITGVSTGVSAGRLSADYGSTPTSITGSNLIVLNISGSAVTPLTFTTQPTSPQSVNTGGSLNLVYIVNNTNASAISINSIAFTSNSLYNPNNPIITPSGAGCSLTSIPASSSCTYTVNITAGSVAGSATNQKLTVDYTGGSPLVSNLITVNIASASSTLIFTVQAPSTSVTVSGTADLLYQVSNPGSSAASFTPTFTTSALFTVGTITNDCSGTVPANGICNITVPITGVTAGVATNQNLTVDDGSTPIVSSDINITVTASGAQLLAFSPPTQQSWNILLGQTANIPFTVINTSGSAVPLTGLNFTSSPLYTVGAITVTGTGCSTSSIPTTGCTVTVPVTANGTTTGTALGQLTIDYTGGGPLIYTSPLDINVTNSSSQLSFGTPMPVIQNMSTYMQQTLVYPVQNNTTSNIPITSVAVTSSPGDTSVVNYMTSCQIPGTQGVVAANQTCYVVVTLTTNGTTGAIAQDLNINYAGGPLTTPISFNVATQTTSRTITFVNQCTNQSIALGINPGTVNNAYNVNSTSCSTSSDCNQGASCVLTNQITGDKQCIWNAPVPADGNYQLSAAPSTTIPGGTATVTVPYDSAENAVIAGEIFNTGISGRTGCSSATNSCSTADCSNGVFPGNGACNPGTGFQQPASAGEINLFLGSLPAPAPPTDTYDGSLINGFNVPFSIEPSISNGRSTNPYACGIPGNQNEVTATNGNLGGCTWNYNWGASDEIYFTRITSPSSTMCTASTNCGAGLVCGVSSSAVSSAASGSSPQTFCGTFAGYWSAGQACSLNGNLGSPFNCSTSSSGLPLSSWYLCNAGAAANSCYGGTANNCCGCQNWNEYTPSIIVPAAPTVTSCGTATSTGWTTPASLGLGTPLLFAGVAKQACPSFYSYQFDDPSSTFNCGAAPDGLSPHVGTVNTTDYTVTFCPGGQNGAPT